MKIDEDGKGMEPALVTRGVGLLGMRERVIAAGGEFFLRSAPGCGVHIEIHLPSNVLKEKSDELSQDTE